MLTGMRTIGLTLSTGRDDYATATVDLDFPPVFTLVTISSSRFFSFPRPEWVHYRAGILNFRFRNADGFDTQVDFPAGPTDDFNLLPAAVAHDQMTHITMALWVLGGTGRGLCTAYHWR